MGNKKHRIYKADPNPMKCNTLKILIWIKLKPSDQDWLWLSLATNKQQEPNFHKLKLHSKSFQSVIILSSFFSTHYNLRPTSLKSATHVTMGRPFFHHYHLGNFVTTIIYSRDIVISKELGKTLTMHSLIYFLCLHIN